jgi:hypothetical protein
MKRFVLVLTATAFLALAPLSLAILLGGEYQGGIKDDPDSSIGFDRTGGKVKKVVLSGIDYKCEEGLPGETPGVKVLGSFKVDENGRFGGTAQSIILGFDPKAVLDGRLKRGGSAHGTIKLSGELDPDDQPGIKCKTGEQKWTAEQVPG